MTIVSSVSTVIDEVVSRLIRLLVLNDINVERLAIDDAIVFGVLLLTSRCPATLGLISFLEGCVSSGLRLGCLTSSPTYSSACLKSCSSACMGQIQDMD